MAGKGKMRKEAKFSLLPWGPATHAGKMPPISGNQKEKVKRAKEAATCGHGTSFGATAPLCTGPRILPGAYPGQA